MGVRLTPAWPAPAKLNRFLRIVGRRADGYHLLQTLFQFLDRADELRFELCDDTRIERVTGPAEVPPEADLTVRAARLLQTRCGVDRGVRIHLDKHLPLGGGLGGGSSDAATTLVALNHHWGLGLTLDELTELGLQLGADVPVFVQGRAAWAEGVGERLTPVTPDEPWFVVVIPPCQVATAEVFNDPGLTRDARPSKIRSFLTEADGNDCEAVVFRRYPRVAEVAEWLSQYGKVRMTGTGACLFAAFAERDSAERILASRPKWLNGFVSRGRNRSGLHEYLERVTIAQETN